MTLPSVLGLTVERALERLAQCGAEEVQVTISGRRREGQPRVIRATVSPQGVLLVATHVRGLAHGDLGTQERDAHV